MRLIAPLFIALITLSISVFAEEQAISLETPTGAINGSLLIPQNITKPLVVLIIAGSGPTDRNGNAPVAAGKNDSLKMLAFALKDMGVASVRYDKRGVASSVQAGIAESDLRIENYIQDATSWIEMLAKDTRFSSVVVLGHSEGSLIGMLASKNSESTAFISIAGPADKAADILRRQLKGKLPDDLASQNEDILKLLESGKLASEVPAPLLMLYRPSVQPYLISWFKYSPTNELSTLKVPCLILQGDTDIQVGVVDGEQLQAANKACSIKVISGMNHVLKLVASDTSKQIASYGDLTLPLAPELSNSLKQFLLKGGMLKTIKAGSQ